MLRGKLLTRGEPPLTRTSVVKNTKIDTVRKKGQFQKQIIAHHDTPVMSFNLIAFLKL